MCRRREQRDKPTKMTVPGPLDPTPAASKVTHSAVNPSVVHIPVQTCAIRPEAMVAPVRLGERAQLTVCVGGVALVCVGIAIAYVLTAEP